MTRTRSIVYELIDAEPPVTSQWYGAEDMLAASEPEMVIDLPRLMANPRALHQEVTVFLIDHGLDSTRATDMADRLILALPRLHPATLGVIVRGTGAGHWQIVAERGQ